MVLNNIEQLIKKYENGETTLQEEQQLKHYFSKETVASHLQVYKPLFVYFLANQQEQFTKTLPLKTKQPKRYKWLAVAAVIVFIFSVFMVMQNNTKQLTKEELYALNQTKKVLHLVSSKLNKGASSMKHVSRFEKTTNSILKKQNQ